MTAKQLVLETRSSLEEALQRGGVWQDWPGGRLDPAPAPFWGELVTERMLIPHRDRLPYMPVSLACIPGALVVDRAFMADGAGELFLSSEQFPAYLNNWVEKGERPSPYRPLSELREISLPGVSALVHHCHSDIYGHWLVEGLPKLLYLRTLPVKPARFIVEKGTLPHIPNWIAHVAPDVEIVNYDPETEYVRCEMLISPTMACSPRYVINPKLGPLLDEIAPSRPANRLLYLDRVRQGAYHWVINKDELRETAQSFGFEVYYPLRQPVQEQIDVFASARILAADYGSALHNSMFSPPETRVLAFNWVTQIQSRICQLRGQRFGFQLGDTGQPVIEQGYRIDIDAAKRAFEAVLSL